ncbi:MAG: HAD family hydrolase [Micropruina glycogenica]
MTSVVLLDIDGTLVDYRTDLPASAAAAVRTARAGGHRVYLCTGRSRAEIYPELWQLGVDGLIGGNGSYVESSGEVIFHQVMDAAVVAEAIDWMSGDGLGYYLECNSGLFGSADLPQRAAAAIGRPGAEGEQFVRSVFPAMIYQPWPVPVDVNKISFALRPDVDLDALAERFAGRAGIDSWSATGKGAEFGEIGQLGIHKGAAIERLAAHLGVSTAGLIGMGDARSDLEMFAVCGTSVAMGNAPADVQAAADLVTDHVDDDGLAKAFVRLGLIDA